MKRLFIAIHLQATPALLLLLEQLKQQLARERISWAKSENMHLTLKFIGETPEKAIPVIVSAIEQALESQKSFEFTFDRTGVFGSRYDPRVIWLGSSKTSAEINLLAEKVIDACDRSGFARDRQNFVPHLTLGRIKGLEDKPSFQRVMQQLPQQVFQQSAVKEIILFESILRKEGPLYVPIHRFVLG